MKPIAASEEGFSQAPVGTQTSPRDPEKRNYDDMNSHFRARANVVIRPYCPINSSKIIIATHASDLSSAYSLVIS